jgi:hypothetical protein
VPTDEFFKRIAEMEEPAEIAVRDERPGTAARRARSRTQVDESSSSEGEDQEATQQVETEPEATPQRRTQMAGRWLALIAGVTAVAGVAVAATIAVIGPSGHKTAGRSSGVEVIHYPATQPAIKTKSAGRPQPRRRKVAKRTTDVRRQTETRSAVGTSSAALLRTEPVGRVSTVSHGRDGFGFEDGAR